MLYITTVVYNKKVKDISSRINVNKLIEKYGRENIKVIIVDNSVSDFINQFDDEFRDIISKVGIIYIRSEGNVGLSKAYNSAFKHALHVTNDPKNDFMLILDDDSDVSFEYLESVYLNVVELTKKPSDINVITGLISAGGRPMSPVTGFKFMYRGKDYIIEPGVYEDICAINSGMAVRLDALEKVNGFDERLFLDMVDYALFFELKRHGLCKVLVMDEKFVQSFSGREKQDSRAVNRRYEIYKKDFTTFCQNVGYNKAFITLSLLKRRISIELHNNE